MTIWTLLAVPRSDYRHVRSLGADARANFRLWINATQCRSGKFKHWYDDSTQRLLQVFVEFDERALAKAAGAFWCRERKMWLFATNRPDDEPPRFIRHRLHEPPVVALEVPYGMKDEVKAAGFRWHAASKRWVIAQRRAEAALARAPALRAYAV
jgi:Domain of unknown function (DUF5710)